MLGCYNALRAKGRKRKTARQTVRRVIATCRRAGFRYLSDITPGKVEMFLSELRNDGAGITAQTYNHYVRNIGQFCRWMGHTGRAECNPLEHLRPLEAAKVRNECRRERRAVTPNEMRQVIAAAQAGPVRGGALGPERALVYWLAVMTGLRANEIKCLSAGDFQLSDEPCVTIRATSAKNSQTAILPLPDDLAEDLRNHLITKAPGARAFNLPHVSGGFAKMLTADLKAAQIASVDEAGRNL